MSSRRPQMNPRRPERSPRRRKTSPRRPQGANLTLLSCFGLLFSRVSKTRETYEAIRVLQGPATVGSYRSAPSSNRPASPRSGRARAEALVRACRLDSRAALVTLALPLFVVMGRSFSRSCCSRCSRLACNVGRSLASRASRSMIARFLFLGVLFRTSRFSQKMQPFHTKTLIFKVSGVQKWSQKWGPR